MPIGSIVGGLIGQGGANAAAGAFGQAGQNADFIRRQNEAKLSPWWQSGYEAQNVLSGLLGLGHFVQDGQGYGGVRLNNGNWQGDQANAFSRFKESPDYQFRFDEGQRALDRSAASKGMLLSGAQNKASQEYGGNLASQEYNNWFNKLAGMGGQGLSAANATVGSNLNTLAQGNAALGGQANAYQSGANALASGIGSAVNSAASLFGMFGGFGGGGGVSFNPSAAPPGGYGGYAGYANSLPGFSGL